MRQAIISYVGPMPYHDGGGAVDMYPFVPCLDARVDGELLLKVWIQLSFEGGVNARARLERDGHAAGSVDDIISTALLLYGVRRTELVVSDLLATGGVADQSDVWKLGTDDVPELLALTGDKACRFQRRRDGDLYCIAAAPSDKSAVGAIDGRRAAPTTRAFCRSCGLPNTDYACSHLRHIGVAALMTASGVADRRLVDALCDLGRPEVGSPGNCRAGGNACWQRTVEAEEARAAALSSLSLPESFDVLDSVWRLTFGRSKRLLSLGTTMVPAALVLECAGRSEFESRVSALADLIDLLRVDEDLLPEGLSDQEKTGSINRLERCLRAKLPTEQHAQVAHAITLLRRVRQTRNALQHSAVDGGFTKSLRELGIHDAPPNWTGAWMTIRARTVDALTIIRSELRRSLESQN